MIAKLKNKLYNFYIDYTYSKIINTSKKKINHNLKIDQDIQNLLNKLKIDGAITYDKFKADDKMISYYTDLLKKKINEKSTFAKYPFFSHPLVFQRNTIVEKILNDKKIITLIKSYIGDDAILDYISLMVTKSNTQNKIVSEKWHYDNVGKRIKMFLYLNNNENISTDYIKGSNKLIHKKYSTEGSRVKETQIKKYLNNLEIFLPSKGKILIFDTNGYHRGNYISSNVEKLSKDDFRILIKFEFSSKEKSDKFFEKSDSIGPRSTFFSNDFNFDCMDILDKNSLTKLDNFFYYDKKFSNNI